MSNDKEKFSNLFGFKSEEYESHKENIFLVDPDDLIPFKNHIFSPYDDETMKDLMSSVEEIGQLSPVLVRHHPEIENKYEILSGQNRTEACRRLKRQVIIYLYPEDLTEDEAKLIVIEANVNQRNIEDFKLSERAAIVSERHDLMKKQGLRTDLIHEIEGQKNNEADAAPFHLGKTQIRNYVRIHKYLIDELKRLLDVEKIRIKGAVEISYLEPDEQKVVEQFINEGLKITDNKAKAIRKKALDAVITKEVLNEMLTKKKKDSKAEKNVKVPSYLIDLYFSESEEDDIFTVMQLALEQFFKSNDNVQRSTKEISQEVNISFDEEPLSLIQSASECDFKDSESDEILKSE